MPSNIDVYIWSPGHDKFIIFDDLTKLIVFVVILVSFYIVTKFNVRPKN